MNEQGSAQREAWLLELRRMNERQEPLLDPDIAVRYDPYAEEIEPTHREFVGRFLSELPSNGSVLDAACGTGKYVPTVLASGRSLVVVDHVERYLREVGARFPEVSTDRYALQDLPYRDAFDGVMSVDAMEFVPPEDWSRVLGRFRDALRSPGWLYLTIELHTEDWILERNGRARREGLPVIDREVVLQDPVPYYHHFPVLEQVRGWLAHAGFSIEGDAEGPWHEGNYAYHHFLTRAD